MSLRVVALGTSQMLASCCEAWRRNHTVVGVISMPEETRPQNSADLRTYARSIDADYFEFADINSADALQSLGDLAPDIVFSMWPKLLRAPAIAAGGIGCIGTHWTELPANRGRHPLHWTIALGLQRAAVSFFKMDAGVDSGDILLQVSFQLSGADTVVDGLAKLSAAAVEGCRRLSERLADKAELSGTPQDARNANYWRARTVHDTIIDFRMSRSAIDRLVRSYCVPFPGAKILYRDVLVPVDRTSMESSEEWGPNLEPGRILRRETTSLIVKADDGAIRLFVRDAADLGHFREGECILPPTSYPMSL